MTKNRLSRYERSKDVSFQMTERDVEVIRAVNKSRYLRTNQIKRLIGFPSLQVTRNRLRPLWHNKFLNRFAPPSLSGNLSAENAYYLGSKGIELLQGLGDEVLIYKKNSSVKLGFLNHTLDISEFRVLLTLALARQNVVDLHRFVSDFEMKTHLAGLHGLQRYRLFDSVIHPLTQQKYSIYPDILMILKGINNYEGHQRLFFVEIDRGTEGLRQVIEKVTGYYLYYQYRMFQKYGQFKKFKVLLQTNSEKRAKNIRDSLVEHNGSSLVWVTHYHKVTENSILQEKIWIDSNYQPKSIIK